MARIRRRLPFLIRNQDAGAVADLQGGVLKKGCEIYEGKILKIRVKMLLAMTGTGMAPCRRAADSRPYIRNADFRVSGKRDVEDAVPYGRKPTCKRRGDSRIARRHCTVSTELRPGRSLRFRETGDRKGRPFGRNKDWSR